MIYYSKALKEYVYVSNDNFVYGKPSLIILKGYNNNIDKDKVAKYIEENKSVFNELDINLIFS